MIGQAGGPQAEALLRQAIQGLEQVPSVRAKVRQRVSLEGESLVGSGTYQQANYGSDSLFRLELKIPLGADRVSTLLQVGDGRFLWTSRSVPEPIQLDSPAKPVQPRVSALDTQGMSMTPEVTRVDLNKVRSSGTLPNVTAFGGLPHTLRQIGRRYAFESAARHRLQELEVWRLVGTRHSHGSDDESDEAQQGVGQGGEPHVVVLVIGADDFFPYRIEFRNNLEDASGSSGTLIVSAGKQQSVAMDFFEVQTGATIDPRNFEFKPRDNRVTDVTDRYLANTQAN